MKIQFLKLAEYLITDKNINSNELRVYAYLINLFNKEKGCSYPSIETIAKDINLSDRTVKNCIAKLVKLKYMTIEKKKSVKGNYNTYKNFKFIVPDKEEKKISRKIGADSNGNTSLDGQVSVEEGLKEAESKELTLEEELAKETSAPIEEVKEAVEYAKDNNARDIKAYVKKCLENNWHKPQRTESKGINPFKFNNFKAREYDYDSLEAQLLGHKEVEVSITDDMPIGIDWLLNKNI